jgi:peptidyl-prolyl cis-trans isomerase C
VDERLNELKNRYPTPQDYEKWLAGIGKTEDQIKKEIKKGMGIQLLIERHVQGEYNPTDDEIKKFYEEKKSMFVKPEQVKASHILVAFKEDSTAAGKAKAKTKADELLAKVKGGTDFAEVAKSSSDCPSSKDGGDLGFFSKGQMVKPFEDKAFSLKQGEISDLVQTQFGYHIIKVVDHKAEETIPFDQSKENIVNILKRQEEQKKMENYIKTLYQKAKVKYASGFEPEKKDGLPW